MNFEKKKACLLKFIIHQTFQMKRRDVILIIDGFSSVSESHRKSFMLLFPPDKHFSAVEGLAQREI